MNALPLTLSLLCMAFIMSLTSLQRGRDQLLLGYFFVEHLQAEKSLEEAYQHTLYSFKCSFNLPHKKRKCTKKPGERSEGKHKKDASNEKKRNLLHYPSHLNLRGLNPKDCRVEILAKLISHLFDLPSAEELSHALAEKLSQQRDIALAEELACVDLGPLQPTWAHVLRNGLLDYIAISESQTINVAWAPRPLLIATFENEQVVDQIIELRATLIDEYINEKTTEKSKEILDRKSQILKKEVETLLSHTPICSRYEKILDFSLRHRPKKVTHRSTSKLPLKRHRPV